LNVGISVGLPRMHQEAGERRDFLPDLVRFLDRAGAGSIVLEDGYGAGMGFDIDAYLNPSSRVRIGDEAECYEQDLVLILRCPDDDRLRLVRPGAVLVSMLHYPTRPERVALLLRLGVHAVSLDGVIDVETGHRMVENLEAVGWNGVREAFAQIQRLHPHFDHPSRRPLHVTCLGSGAVGGYAVHAATRYGNRSLREELIAKKVPGVEVTVVDFDLSWHEEYMLERLERTDLLIDATQRRDPSRPVIPNRWIAALPEDAVILDLAADPYDFSVAPPVVKGIEGIPHGNLDRYLFPPDDAAYDSLDPRVDAANRRLALSCYSWPGIDPLSSMRVYGEQVEPILQLLLERPVEAWDDADGSHEERAVARAEVARWSMTHAR
jgi:alanine dehydrogenase